MTATATDELVQWVTDARQRTIWLVEDLSDEQLIGPRLPIVNPLLWEIAHAAWFQEFWVLRHMGQRLPIRQELDSLYDSIAIDHELRWDLPLLSRAGTMKYLHQVQQRVLEFLAHRAPDEELTYYVKLSVFHEDMHTEAFTYTRQTLGYPAPRWPSSITADAESCGGRAAGGAGHGRGLAGDVEIPAGTYVLGAQREEPFVFDNEMWAHPVRLGPAAIAPAAVTQSEFAEFVDDDGYRRSEFWCREGWRWKLACGADQPLYWQRQTQGRWLRRDFDQWLPLEPDRPMIHVNWFEASAYCRWAGRRLPTEAEWEVAASTGAPDNRQPGRRRYPWGDQPPDVARVNMDWQARGTVPVHAKGPGDSALGCRQMLGNVWEWTASVFQPYPGFEVGPYREYSRSCFGACKVLRGGCWTTRSRLIRNTWRNFYRPDRRDVWAGFRTCAERSC